VAVTSFSFGKTADGEPVTGHHIQNAHGMKATVLDYGATLQGLAVLNRQGTYTDVVLGFDKVADYEAQDAHIGATIGRMANRIGGSQFSLGGKCYKLFANDGENHLHGGKKGFDRYLWNSESGVDYVRFSRLSPDGEEGYPGNLSVSVTYQLDDSNALHIIYDALCDEDTIVSLTNHSYFNLNGSGSVLSQELQINAERYLELGAGVLPTGKALGVENSPFDFRSFKPIGRDISADHPQLAIGGGYDHNFILSGSLAAIARSHDTGIELRCYTDLPGMQLYTANFLAECKGKNGVLMGKHGAFCLETQLYPNAMNCYGFPSPVLHTGESLHHETVYRFSTI
jgi:aldose 1-epimerase